MVKNLLNETIEKLEQRNRPQPILPAKKQDINLNIPSDFMGISKNLSKVKSLIFNAVADAVVALQRHTFDVTVKNFPNNKPIEVSNLKNELNLALKTSLQPLERAINNIPSVYIPEIQKVTVTNQVTPPKITFPSKFNVDVLNTSDITQAIDVLTSQVSKMQTGKGGMDTKAMKECFDNMVRELTTAIEQNKITDVNVNNMGSFPVTFPIPTFRDANGATTQARLDANGCVRVSVQQNNALLDKYQPADSDETTATKYYGFVDVDGGWYIFRDTGTTYRYFKGTTDYPTNWTNRAGLAYDYYNIIF